ncbi:hypothetical protein EGI16_21330 [Chryseobacterium sp. G0240]|uniref:hypothetical protein n=1 Tax=Chryseobacterium sp. G0240 TaxID=2487066 RepID=UPI000F4506EE|nr:hypothetical protein [Chryseobacterium sp. G0240]ROH98380.1 hypothetical protein EGI16_21330 [Chryseobacterium sp. G0240]
MANNLESNNRKQVRKAIGLDLLGYGNLIHRNFITWCEVLSMKFHYKDRDLITNNTLLKYYTNQWDILVENRLLLEYGEYIKRDIPDTYEFYYRILSEYAEDLEKYYPASLLPKKKITINQKYQFNYN